MSDEATGARERPQPRMQQRITVFRTRRGPLDLWLVLGAFTTVQGVATFIYFYGYAEDVEQPLRSVSLGLAAALVFFGLYFFTYSVGRMRDLDPPIVIGPAGLHDRWVSERPIPWEQIRRIMVLSGGRGGPYIVFDLSEEDADRAGVWPLRHEMGRLSRRIAGYGFRIHHTGTEATPALLVEAIRPYREVERADIVLGR